MKISFLIFIVIIASCQSRQRPFSIEDWNYKEDIIYAKRKFLVDDLISNRIYKGLSYNSVINLLGEPENYTGTENTIEYEIEEIYGSDIDPIKGSYLAITFNPDSTVIAVEQVKWER